jgi:DNA-binding PucR family transcriptional regulator
VDSWREAAHAVVLCTDPFETTADSAATSSGSDSSPPMARVLRDRLAALAPGLGRDRVAVGLSDRFNQAADLAGAIEEARLAMRLAMRRPGQLELAEHDELASHLVLLAHVPDELRRGYRDRLLGPLRAYDMRHHSQLEETLDRFLACSASWSRCAQAMHIHVNTLRYRIDKINQLTGRDLARLDHQVDFYLALRAR